MGNKENERVKRKIRELRIEMGGRCANPFCETPYEKLEFAHTKRTGLSGWGRGRKERYYDVFKHPDCYILLCHKCHRLFDNGELNFADFNRFICPNWNMFWEVVYVEKFVEDIQRYQLGDCELTVTDTTVIIGQPHEWIPYMDDVKIE